MTNAYIASASKTTDAQRNPSTRDLACGARTLNLHSFVVCGPEDLSTPLEHMSQVCFESLTHQLPKSSNADENHQSLSSATVL